MVCANCGKQIAENSNFCYFCGSRQYGNAGAAPGARPAGGGVGPRRLYRSTTNKSMAGVLGGFAEYLDIDPSLLRVIYVLVTFFTGIIPGVLAYLVAWMVMSEAPADGEAPNVWAAARGAKRLMRSVSNRKWAGVCGGLGEYLDVDPTVVRIIWVVLSIVPGSIIGGFIVYLIAWMVMPEAPRQLSAASEGAGQPVAHSS
jgi:phage shock protein PspC (stress-responsive transcriptional regulator)